MSHAWQTTEEDVENVLRRMGRKIDGAYRILRGLNTDLIERAALRGNDMESQTDGAYDEIERQIKEGV